MSTDEIIINHLVQYLLCDTHWKENGTEISLLPLEGEKALFFRIDGENNEELKQYLGMSGKNEQMCDLLIYYQKKLGNGSFKKVICLAEGKGGDIPHAVKQIQNTYTATKDKLKIFSGITWAAYIEINCKSSPRDVKRPISELASVGIKNCEIGKCKFQNFIRRIN
jgi:hypothetical protein